jgi:peptidoglycan/LPS O-acetylase OafA/YrhL
MIIEESVLVRPRTPVVLSAPASRPVHHVESLDGLRALAIGVVMGFHAGVPGLDLGWLGVDLFFVLSGFLITSLLVKEFGRTGRIDVGKFWARRFLRLMPAYWLYAGFITWAMTTGRWGWVADHGGWTPTSYIISIWTYVVNYAPQGGIWQHQSLCLHLWSLSVEEQFYFTWPILCLFLLRARVAWVVWVFVAALILHQGLASRSVSIHRLDTRGFEIMLGSAVALTLSRSSSPGSWLKSSAFRIAVLVGTVAAIAITTIVQARGLATEDQVHRYTTPIIASLFAGFIASLWYGPKDSIAEALCWRPLVFVGKISYGMYLYHMLAHYLTWEVLLGRGIDGWSRWPKFGLRLTLFGALTVAIASISYLVIEKRFLSLKARFR